MGHLGRAVAAVGACLAVALGIGAAYAEDSASPTQEGETFSLAAAPVSAERLRGYTGQKDVSQLNIAELGATVTNNSANYAHGGSITIDSSFHDIHGVASGVINSGPNAVIQNATNINFILN